MEEGISHVPTVGTAGCTSLSCLTRSSLASFPLDLVSTDLGKPIQVDESVQRKSIFAPGEAGGMKAGMERSKEAGDMEKARGRKGERRLGDRRQCEGGWGHGEVRRTEGGKEAGGWKEA